MQAFQNWTGVSLILMTTLACGDLEGPSGTTPPGVTPAEGIETTEGTSGLMTSLVNASDHVDWVYMDLESGNAVTVDDPLTSDAWDIAFQRFKVKVNGGISGNQNVEVAVLEGETFATLSEAPADGYVTDREDGEDTGELDDYAISVTRDSESGPWAYNNDNHSLFGSDFVFVVRSVEGNYYKLAFDNYYNEIGEAGHVEFRWSQLEGQALPGVVKLTATAEWQYYSLKTSDFVDASTATTSADWDLALRAFAWRTNSGDDVVGQGGAQLAPEGSNWDDITQAPTDGYEVDADITDPGPAGGEIRANEPLTEWFDYDFNTHEIWAKEGRILFVRGGDGAQYAKVQIMDYHVATRTYSVRIETIPGQ